MPKLGMEPIRRRALIDAAIAEIGAKGGLDVTVGQIAKRAGVSAALAHHYFGNKQQILIETMRHLLREFNAIAKRRMRAGQTPRERLSAIVEASFGVDGCDLARLLCGDPEVFRGLHAPERLYPSPAEQSPAFAEATQPTP
jgi:AcrR family transcriptional regulator